MVSLAEFGPALVGVPADDGVGGEVMEGGGTLMFCGITSGGGLFELVEDLVPVLVDVFGPT